MLKKIGIVAILAFIGYGLFTLGGVTVDTKFKAKLEAGTDELVTVITGVVPFANGPT